jgi:hypothetical protein
MKRSFKNLFILFMILVLLIGSSIQTTPVDALGAVTRVPNLSNPGVGSLSGVWSADANNVFAVGYGSASMASAKLPIVYRGHGTDWTFTNFAASSLPVATWDTGEFYAVWGADTSHVFAVGAGGDGTTPTLPMVFSWNGSTWVSANPGLPTTTPLSTSGFLYGVWGSSASNVYAVGKGVAGGNYPMVSHWNGSAWSSTALSLPTGWTRGELKAVWGSGASNIYAVGNGQNSAGSIVPLLYRYNGSTWSSSSLSLPSGWNSGFLVDIWGSSASDIYLVGSGNNALLLYHYNGSGWSLVNLPLPSTGWTSGELKSIWGFDTDNVYIVGVGVESNVTAPFLYRKTSSGWAVSTYSPQDYISEHFDGISGSSANDVYVVGRGSQILEEVPLIYYAGPDEIDPGPVTNLIGTSGRSNGTVKLTWTAPADDGDQSDSGPVDSYLVKYSTSPLADCSGGTEVTSGLPIPVVPGNIQVMRVSGLTPGTLYYFAVCAKDEEDRESSPATISATANTGYLSPEATTLIAPSGSAGSSQPTYVWNDNIDSTWYYLYVNGPSGNVIKQWFSSAQANCNGTICSATPTTTLVTGAHTWWVQTYNAAGYGAWSAGTSFGVPVPVVPEAATLVSPSGSIGTNTPMYTWNQISNAT